MGIENRTYRHTADGRRAARSPADRACWSFALAALVALLLPGAVASQETGRVAGRVLDSEGRPVAEARIVVVGTDLGAQTSTEGRFVIRGVPVGARSVRVQRIGFDPLVREVEVRAGAESTVELRLATRPVAVERVHVTVIGSAAEQAELQERLREIPGAVEHLGSETIERTRQANLKDVLRFTPGVYVQPRFGAADESQLSIRGSGLRNNFHLRGVNILVNGMPYRNADGFTDFESLELLTVNNIQVYKGGNALRYGGSTLGGAVNLQTETGYTATTANLFAQGGSHAFFKGQASSGGTLGDFDYYLSYARSDVDGFRDFAHNERDRVNAHAGWVISPNVDLRTFYFFAYVREDLPGSLTGEEFEEDPTRANPTNVADRHGRDYTLHHVGVQLRSQLGATQTLEVSPYLQYRDIVHPIFRVLDQVSRDWGVEARYENKGGVAGHGNRLTLGFQGAIGETDNRHFENEGGERGELAKDQLDEAATIAFYGEDVFDVTDRLSAVLGLRYDRARRAVDDLFLEDGDQTDERWMDAVIPKIGLTYDLPAIGGQLFANASRLFEPPLLLELNSFTVPGFIDLDAQTAWQFEVGTRGEKGDLGWTLAAYDLELWDEIINVNVQPFPDAPFTVPTYRNAERTRHYGLEAGLDYRLPGPVASREGEADELVLSLAYTFARYEFVRDSVFEGNEIPGAPSHVVQAELAYRHPIGLTLRPNIEWVADDYFVDSENSVTNEGWTLLGLRAEWEMPPSLGATLFVEARNLTDERYSPSVSVDDAAGRFFQPGDGRSIYGGVRWRL